MTSDRKSPIVLDHLEFRPKFDPSTQRNAELMGLLARRQWRAGRRRLVVCVVGALLLAAGFVLGMVVDSSPQALAVTLGLATTGLCLTASVALALALRRIDRRR